MTAEWTSSSETILLSTAKATFIAADDNQNARIMNLLNGTVYYKSTSNVSAALNDGSLAPGASVTLTTGTYVLPTLATKLSITMFSPVKLPGNQVARPGSAAIATSSTAEYINVKDSPYSATGDGVTDDTGAIQSALTAVASAKGTLFFPAGTYKYSTPLTINNFGFELRGAGGSAEYSTLSSKLLYTGTTDRAFRAYSAAFAMRNLLFQYNSASFTGDLVDMDGDQRGGDVADWEVVNCASAATGAAAATGTGSSGTARSGLHLSKCIIGKVSRCHWTGADGGIRVGENGTYVVAVDVDDQTTFNFCRSAGIVIASGDLESFSVKGCTFEAGTSMPAIKGSGCQIYSMSIEDCWMGDSGAATTWIDGLNLISRGTLHIKNCFFGDNNGGFHLKNISENSGGTVIIEGGRMVAGTGFHGAAGNNVNLILIGIGDFTSTMLASGTNAPAGLVNIPGSGGEVLFRLGRTATLPAVGSFPTLTARDRLVMYAQDSGTLVDPGYASIVYNADTNTVVQAPSKTSAGGEWTVGEVKLVGGGSAGGRAPGVRAGKNASGFNGTAPVTAPALPIAAVDATTTQALANALRAALIANGLCT